MRVTIVIACEGALPDPASIPDWLSAARRAARRGCDTPGAALSVSLVVVGDSDGRSETRGATSIAPGVTEEWIKVPAGSLVPVRWAAGMRVADGDAIGLSIDRCTLGDEWVVAAVAGLRAGHVGVGGGFRLRDGHSSLDTAVYHLRYGAFPPGGPSLAPTAGELAGDNAMYARQALQEQIETWRAGFWEVVLHRVWRQEGRTLARSAGMDVAFGGNHGLTAFLLARFRHGQHAGAWRNADQGISRARILLCSPVVPVVLFLRAWSRAGNLDEGRSGLLRAAPEFLLLAVAWAAGEGSGVLRQRDNK